MSQIVIVDNEYILVEYVPEKKMIHHIIHKPVGGQLFRDALNAGTEALKKNGACKWLSDDRKYWALVVPPAVVAAGSLIPTMAALFELGLRMMVFSDLDEASEWLDGLEC
jgi:hypothetical protein